MSLDRAERNWEAAQEGGYQRGLDRDEAIADLANAMLAELKFDSATISEALGESDLSEIVTAFNDPAGSSSDIGAAVRQIVHNYWTAWCQREAEKQYEARP